MQRSRLLAATGLLIGLAACGSSGSSTSTTPVPADVVISATEGIHWDAPTYTAAAKSGKVVISGVNKSSIGHNLYLIAADGTQNPSHIDLPQRNKTVTETFDVAPGTYTVICKVPGHTQMKSTLTVS
jgi:plastocyanin